MSEAKRLSNEMQIRGKDLIFSSPFNSAEFFLVEVDKELADEVLNGKDIVVRGKVDDYVTMCTDSKTYATKEVEISNTMLVTENLNSKNFNLDCPKVNYTTKYLRL